MKKMAKSLGLLAVIGLATLSVGACSTVDQPARDQAAAALAAAQRAEAAANQAQQSAAAAQASAERVERIFQHNLRK